MSLSEMSQWQEGEAIAGERVALGLDVPSFHLVRGRMLTTGQQRKD